MVGSEILTIVVSRAPINEASEIRSRMSHCGELFAE
jgi:hypothetical protein